MAERRVGPDQLRALLLALVIFGHTIPATVSDDLTKWIMYSFHMPLFLALSGSLLSISRISSRGLGATIQHYARRMGWQWLLATVIFMAVRDRWPINASQVLSRVITDPYFHLWFVPALVFMVLLTWTLGRLQRGIGSVLLVGAVGWVLFDAAQIQFLSDAFHANNVDYRFIGFYLWFGLGMAASLGLLHRFELVAPFLSVIGIVGVTLSFGSSGWLRDVSVLLLNFSLITVLPHFFRSLDRPVPFFGTALALVGKYSLWIYLLHPLATSLLKDNASSPYANPLGGLALTAGILTFSAGCAWAFERIRPTASATPR